MCVEVVLVGAYAGRLSFVQHVLPCDLGPGLGLVLVVGLVVGLGLGLGLGLVECRGGGVMVVGNGGWRPPANHGNTLVSWCHSGRRRSL